MEKLIAKLLVGAFSLVLCVNLSAEEWKTYKFTANSGTSSINVFSKDIITLAKEDKMEFISLIGTTPNDSRLLVNISLDDDFNVTMDYPPTNERGVHGIRQNFETVYGPCQVKIGGRNKNQQGVMCVIKITRANETQGKNVTGYSLVLPESTDTNYNLVLESSTDLVSWTADTTGTKTPSDKKRFYRLRAVKE
jgi:hypothetical protein